ncbi:DMT(drug/metabolite transporter) superfamily permease [Mesotoga prima MesG1.Ag.4.2]|uniref:DMT(Drug/metabolite transporter) superfamily permease n=2 Tax=Mesotoga TaxID=1184396 RepID=I2F539_9BACT|nr:DMT family transporter [Mesotoga prima]AFK07042.1 DMT(drug/metabolite transporter) superfamily permease [Mesotoga prima MesG1.Ag.4.2]
MKLKSKAYVNLLLVVIFWGLTFPVQKNILEGLSPVFYNALRFSIALLILIPLRKKLGLKITNKSLTQGLILGLFLSGGYVFQTWGLVYTTASKSAFITSLYVGLVAIIGPVVDRRIPSRYQILALGVSLIGLYFLTTPETGFNFGDLLTALCAVSFALHVVLISYFTQKEDVDEMELLVPQFVVVLLVNMALIPFVKGSVFINGSILFVALFSAVFATIFAVAVQLKYQRFLGSVGASLIYVGEPAFALFFAMIILREIPGKMEVVGLLLMTAGMVLGGISSFVMRDRSVKKG